MRPTGTTFSPARRPTGGRSRRVRIGRAAIGPAAPKAPQWSGTSTAKVCATMRRRDLGIHRILRAGRMGAAVRRICAAPVATAYSIASPPNDDLKHNLEYRESDSGPARAGPLSDICSAATTFPVNKWHAAKWPGYTSRVTGVSLLQRASAYGQRVWK